MSSGFQSPHPGHPAATDLTAEAGTSGPDSVGKALAEQREQHLRLAADFENFRRRSRLEAELRAVAQKTVFIQELLPAIDNLERALAADASPGSAPLHQGVEMTLQQLRQLLRQHGVDSPECAGQPFDPRQHEAVSARHDPAQPDQAILEVFQRGYRQGEKVLRPAKVVVNDWTLSRPTRHAR